MLVPRNNKMTTPRKIELWITAHGVELLLRVGLFAAGMALMYGIMFATAWCLDQNSTVWHAWGWLLCMATASVIYYVLRPLPER